MSELDPFAPPEIPWILQAAYDSPFATFIRESETLFPILQTLHVLGIMVMIGTVAVVDLRVLGLLLKDRPVAEVSRTLLPYTWLGFAIMLVSGGLLLVAQVGRIYENEFLRIKLVLLVLAGLNVVVFHGSSRRTIDTWGNTGTPDSARLSATLSLALWVGVVITGRYIAYF